ncbi:MAG: fumarylacetoacetate hydrolase family protein [Dehalococcoidia bacterium]|nr:MAG: fumarylacetoacetate hydrolase family protein [Dehalococcoidia bacterium]
MKIVRFSADNKARYGVLDGQIIKVIEGKPFRHMKLTGQIYPRHEVRLLAPCEPSKIIAMGLNYHSHARELNLSLPNSPLTFLKPSTAVVGPGADIVYPAVSARVDYEGELAVVIKKPIWRVAAVDALDYVLGYACFNDVTARDLQNHDGQWTRAKGFNTFAAVGPWIETELDPSSVMLETYLNGKLKQQGNTADLIYSVPEIINFISNVMTLLPGDIIATGTPNGVGPMYPGDTIEVRIPKLGTLRNFVIKNNI